MVTRFPYTPLFQNLVIEPITEPRMDSSAEIQIRCPFHTDEAPSCRINLKTGLWRCFGCRSSGTATDFVQKIVPCSYGPAYARVRAVLAARREATPTTNVAIRRVLRDAAQYGLAVVRADPEDPEVQQAVRRRDVAALVGLAFRRGLHTLTPASLHMGSELVGSVIWWNELLRLIEEPQTPKVVSPRVIARYRAQLTPARAFTIMKRRGWTKATLHDFQIGYEHRSGRYTIPVTENGVVVNVRRYLPGATHDKFISFRKGYGDPRLFPIDRLFDQKEILLLEGEPDVILAWQLGFIAGTFTGGAQSLAQLAIYRKFFYHRRVWICYDCDPAGRSGALRMADWLKGAADQVWMMDLALPQKGDDFTDFFLRYHRTKEDFMTMFRLSRRVV